MRQTAKRKSFNLLNTILEERNLPVLTEEDYVQLTRDDILDRIEELEEPELYQRSLQHQKKDRTIKRKPSQDEIYNLVDASAALVKTAAAVFGWF